MPTRRIIYKGKGGTDTGSIVLPIDLDPTAPTYITVIGAGGGGGKKNVLSSAGGGGGGALSRGSFYLTPNSTIYFSVGAGGTGPSTNGTAADGGNGGDTWVNISSNSAPTSNTQGVLAKGGSGGQGASGASGGAGGSSSGGYGNIATYSGGAGGVGGSSNGSGGGGGGSAGVWDGNTSYSNGYAGGNGYNISGDGGGGGGGGVLSAGTSATSITGGAGGQGYDSSSASANGTGLYGGGGGGGNGLNSSGAANSAGGGGHTTFNIDGTYNYFFSGGGGGGGGGSNNSSSTGGGGGANPFGYAGGGGGGGGGSGTTNSGAGGVGGNGFFIIEYTAITSPITSNGTISMSTIQNFFGGSNPISLSEYYRSGSYVPSWAKGDSGLLPSTGQISFNDFKGAPYKQNLFITGTRDYGIGGKFSPSYEYYGFASSAWYGNLGLGSIDVNTFSPKSNAVVHSLLYCKSGFLGTNVFIFTLAGTLSNDGWDSLYIVSGAGGVTQFARTSSAHSQAGGYTQWKWTSVTTNPFGVDSSLLPSGYIEGTKHSIYVTV